MKKKIISAIISLAVMTFVITTNALADFSVSWGEGGILRVSGTESTAQMVGVTVRDMGSRDILYVDQTDVNDGGYSFTAYVENNNGIDISIGKSDFSTVAQQFIEKEESIVYVSDSGNDNNIGTSSSPFATLEKAVSAQADLITVLDVAATSADVDFAGKTVTGGKIIINSGTAKNAIFKNTEFSGALQFTDCTFDKDVSASGLNIILSGECNASGLAAGTVTVASGVAHIKGKSRIDKLIVSNGALASISPEAGVASIDNSGRLFYLGKGGSVSATGKIIPLDMRAFSVDGGEYVTDYPEITQIGEYNVVFEYNFRIHSVSLKNDPTSLIPKTVISVDVSTNNLNNDETKATPAILLGVYDGNDNKLKNILVKNVAQNRKTAVDFPVDGLGAENSDIIKIFMWDSFERMIPLTSITANLYENIKQSDETVFYVSPAGNNENDGSLANPFKTVAKAVTEATNSDTIKNRIVLLEGSHNITSKITIGNGKDISFEGESGSSITTAKEIPMSTFTTLTDEEKNKITDNTARDMIVKLNLSDVGITNIGTNFTVDHKYNATLGYVPESLPIITVGSEAMTLSRYPETGYLRIADASTESDTYSKFTFTVTDGITSDYKAQNNLFMIGYLGTDWAYTRYSGKLSYSNTTATFASDGPYEYIAPVANQRIAFTNVLSEIDKPGEWYLDIDNKTIYMYPPLGSENKPVYFGYDLPIDNIFNISGAKNISFDNITFNNCGTGAILAENSENITVKNCEFKNITGKAMTITESKNCEFSQNEVYNLSGTAVLIGGGDAEHLISGNNLCKNNKIYDYSKEFLTYNPAIQLGGVGNTVSYNEIYNSPHTAIMLYGVRNVIEYNEIYNVCAETSDAGAVYAGRTWMAQDNKIICNYFHDIVKSSDITTGAYVTSIYLDDMFSSAKCYNNVFYNVSRACFIGGGRDNSFENNIIIDSVDSAVVDARGIHGLGGALTGEAVMAQVQASLKDYYKNDLWAAEFPLLANILEDEPNAPKYTIVKNNAIYNSNAVSINDYAKPYVNSEGNFEVNDYDFVDYENHNFRISKDSDIFETYNFNDIPFDKIGIK